MTCHSAGEMRGLLFIIIINYNCGIALPFTASTLTPKTARRNPERDKKHQKNKLKSEAKLGSGLRAGGA
jgi:hypothetical protein